MPIIRPDIAQTADPRTFFEDLGRSYDSTFGRKLNNVLVGEPRQESAAPSVDDVFKYTLAQSQQEVSKAMSASASARTRFGGGSARGSARASSFFTSNSYSCYVIGYWKLTQPRYVLDLTACKVDARVGQFLEDHSDEPDLIERELGDEIITAVTVGAEILLKMELQTQSEESRKSIQASLSGSYGAAKASGKVSSFAQAAKSSKKVDIQIFGTIPGEFMKDLSLESADAFLLSFNRTSKGFEKMREFETRRLEDLNQLLGAEVIDEAEVIDRHTFIDALDCSVLDYLDWHGDIAYVTDTANQREFLPATVEQASADKQECDKRLKALETLRVEAFKHWIKHGSNDRAFDMGLLRDPRTAFPVYPRVEPSKPASPPPKPKPKRDPVEHGYHGNSRHDR